MNERKKGRWGKGNEERKKKRPESDEGGKKGEEEREKEQEEEEERKKGRRDWKRVHGYCCFGESCKKLVHARMGREIAKGYMKPPLHLPSS